MAWYQHKLQIQTSDRCCGSKITKINGSCFDSIKIYNQYIYIYQVIEIMFFCSYHLSIHL